LKLVHSGEHSLGFDLPRSSN
jgi:ABC-type multidrug transport system fused ATPase/permease subunit